MEKAILSLCLLAMFVSSRMFAQNNVSKYNEVEIKCNKQPSTKKANAIFLQLKMDEGSVLENEDVKIELNIGIVNAFGDFVQTPRAFNQVLSAKIVNKTDKSIFLDLANTFFTRDGEAEAYYVPTATSNYASSTKGASVNLGAVAGALGVGGALGTLARGVNVGGSNTSGSTTVHYSQRIIGIPPKSSKTLDSKLFFFDDEDIPNLLSAWVRSGGRGVVPHVAWDGLHKYDHLKWEQANSLFNFSFILTYASDEELSSTNMMKSDLYVSDAYATSYSNKYGWFMAKMEDFEGWEQSLHLVLINYTKYLAERYKRTLGSLNCSQIEHIEK